MLPTHSLGEQYYFLKVFFHSRNLAQEYNTFISIRNHSIGVFRNNSNEFLRILKKLGKILHFERLLGYLFALLYKGKGMMWRLTNYLYLPFNKVHNGDPLRTGTYEGAVLRLW